MQVLFEGSSELCRTTTQQSGLRCAVSDSVSLRTIRCVILGGISRFYPTYFTVFTGIRMSRKDLQYQGALEHSHAQVPAEAGHYLIS
jgi:hypothetical protein